MVRLIESGRFVGKIAAPAAFAPEPADDMEPVYSLWDDLDRFSAGDSDAALRHLAMGLKNLLGADNVRWLAVVRVLRGTEARRDGLQGWRIRSSVSLVPDPEEYQRRSGWWYRQNKRMAPEVQVGMATRAMVAGFGRFCVHRMRDGWIPFDEFERTPHYDLYYTKLGVSDRIWVSFPLGADAESMFLVDRIRRPIHFSEKEAALAGATLRGIRGFHRRLFLDRGLLIGESSLSPTARRIVQKLLTGLSEKEIAFSLNQSPATTHKYVKDIYGRFGVNGRAALMALWLGA